jgi:hypothetical protein
LQQADGVMVLQLADRGRRLLIAPSVGAALLWVGEEEPPEDLVGLLLADSAEQPIAELD